MLYRADIDGLRMLAVVPVVLFHAHVPGFSGGFVGVDVFFVISGFLITRLLVADIAAGRFSILTFYERRIRRLWPAYLVVTTATAIGATALMMPGALIDLAHSLWASLLFASNIFFFVDTDYWSGPAHSKPLLHTWSLSVEEQFYVVFPLLLVALYRRQRAWNVTLRAIVSALGLASLIACLVVTEARGGADEGAGAAAFYLAPFRAWELLAGAVLALDPTPRLRRRWAREGAAALGCVGVVVAVVAFNERTAFPGVAALLPVGGAVLVVLAGSSGRSVVGALLSLPPVVFVGKVSYSVYLWHWPVLVFAGLWTSAPLTATETACAIALSFALALATWHFVENPVRDRTVWATRRTLFRGAALGALALASFAAVIHISRGLPARISADVAHLAQARKDANPDRARCHASDARPIPLADACRYGDGTEPTIAIWGDSFAAELGFVLGRELAQRGGSLLYLSHSACPPTLGAFEERPACANHNRAVVDGLAARSSVHTVVVVARYEAYASASGEAAFLAAFGRAVDALVAAGKRVVVVYPIPHPHGPVPTLLATRALRGGDPHDVAIDRDAFDAECAPIRAALDAIVARHGAHVVALHPERALCDRQRCALMLDEDVVYFDAHHLSLRGAARLLPLMREAIGL
jgi:peptidoglycan/LPS O-acetylase OafA/YrhL